MIGAIAAAPLAFPTLEGLALPTLEGLALPAATAAAPFLAAGAAGAGAVAGAIYLIRRGPTPDSAEIIRQKQEFNRDHPRCTPVATGQCLRFGMDGAPENVPALPPSTAAPALPPLRGLTLPEPKPTVLATPPAPELPTRVEEYPVADGPDTSILDMAKRQYIARARRQYMWGLVYPSDRRTLFQLGPIYPYGVWIEKKEGMSAASRRYQDDICGWPGWVFVSTNGAKFDGENYPRLIETKGPKYDSLMFRNKLEWKPKMRTNDKLLRQMKKQNEACLLHDLYVDWHVAEPRPAELMEKMAKEKKFSRIVIHHTPPLAWSP